LTRTGGTLRRGASAEAGLTLAYHAPAFSERFSRGRANQSDLGRKQAASLCRTPPARWPAAGWHAPPPHTHTHRQRGGCSESAVCVVVVWREGGVLGPDQTKGAQSRLRPSVQTAQECFAGRGPAACSRTPGTLPPDATHSSAARVPPCSQSRLQDDRHGDEGCIASVRKVSSFIGSLERRFIGISSN